ncbi:MAG: hypothetical protein V2A73_04260 [Pseudomonadota bacterium]
MGFTGKPSIMKRQKELARREKQKEKAERRANRQTGRKDRPGSEGEDPDIAGIVPGPQPNSGPDDEEDQA